MHLGVVERQPVGQQLGHRRDRLARDAASRPSPRCAAARSSSRRRRCGRACPRSSRACGRRAPAAIDGQGTSLPLPAYGGKFSGTMCVWMSMHSFMRPIIESAHDSLARRFAVLVLEQPLAQAWPRSRSRSSCRSRPAAPPTRSAAWWRRSSPSSSRRASSSRTAPARAARSARSSPPRPRPTATRCVVSGVASHVIAPALPQRHAVRPGAATSRTSRCSAGRRRCSRCNPSRAGEGPAGSSSRWRKRSRARYSYGSPGNGTQGQLVAELFKQLAGIEMQHVPYKGASGAVTDLIAGHIPAVSTTLSTAAGQIHAGRARGARHQRRGAAAGLSRRADLRRVGLPGPGGDRLVLALRRRPACRRRSSSA